MWFTSGFARHTSSVPLSRFSESVGSFCLAVFPLTRNGRREKRRRLARECVSALFSRARNFSEPLPRTAKDLRLVAKDLRVVAFVLAVVTTAQSSILYLFTFYLFKSRSSSGQNDVRTRSSRSMKRKSKARRTRRREVERERTLRTLQVRSSTHTHTTHTHLTRIYHVSIRRGKGPTGYSRAEQVRWLFSAGHRSGPPKLLKLRPGEGTLFLPSVVTSFVCPRSGNLLRHFQRACREQLNRNEIVSVTRIHVSTRGRR